MDDKIRGLSINSETISNRLINCIFTFKSEGLVILF